MKTVTTEEMRGLEREAERKYGISTLLLMENAGRSVAEHANRLARGKRRRFLILCGQGNNGGDGFVAARHLRQLGHRVRVLFLGVRKKLRPDSRVNYVTALKMKLQMIRTAGLARALRGADYVIDALLGTGLNGTVRRPYAKVIDAVNLAKAKVIAVDIPSGLNSDDGRVHGTAIRAEWTVALGRVKGGMVKKTAKPACGKIIVGRIGI